ncbi:hypothetical protein GCM10028803_45660 [Larkinella knui]|uniref:DUF4411 family protein n=1 Tax=Larkinella knui TaxID=2025310 RepID=A0A3P1CPA8_9BACT|nr:hypothetical protein [Larkinella knui]RRB15167.1 hypothetical protein EHT87_11515 [Larkinella knui]
MNAIIDTSSLRALVRYYLPFDKNDSLKNLFKSNFENGSLIILDVVANEAKYQAKKAISTNLEFIYNSSNAKKITSTSSLVPTAKFHRRLDNEFCDHDYLRGKGIVQGDALYQAIKTEYLKSADAKIILYADAQIKGQTLLLESETKLLLFLRNRVLAMTINPLRKYQLYAVYCL